MWLSASLGLTLVTLVVVVGTVTACVIVPWLRRLSDIQVLSWKSGYWLAIATHVLACLGQLLIAPGTEFNPIPSQRAVWIGEHRWLWCAAWGLWPAASSSLLIVLHQWTQSFPASAASHVGLRIGLGLVGLGVVCDFMGESVAAACALPWFGPSEALSAYRVYQWLSPVYANGLYCVGGLCLNACRYTQNPTLVSAESFGFLVWTTGLGLSWAAAWDMRLGILTWGGAVMLLFVVWLTMLHRQLRSASFPPSHR